MLLGEARTPGSVRPRVRQALRQALHQVSYEVLPLRGAEQSVVEHVPQTVPLTVTVTEAKGLEPTLELAERLTRQGFNAAPHIAARLVRDEKHLTDIVARLHDGQVTSVFVIAGDAAEPIGTFHDAYSLLRTMHTLGHHFRNIGIGGYPEGHGHIGEDLIEQALERKASYATHVITQLCFHSATTTTWARRAKDRGVNLPIRVGLPGAVTRQKLVRISASIGLGQSARFLQKQHTLFWRFFLPGGYQPNRLIQQLSPYLERPDQDLEGFHLFTFNELEKTEAWRQSWLTRLSDSAF